MAARPAMAVPPAKGLDEACAWLRKAALTPFPPVTKFEQDHGHGRNKARTRAKLRPETYKPAENIFLKKQILSC